VRWVDPVVNTIAAIVGVAVIIQIVMIVIGGE